MVKQRHFEVSLPFYSDVTNLVCEGPKILGASIKIDGVDLGGKVTDICIRSGTNGYTNVVIEIPASAAIEMTAALVVNVNPDQDTIENLFGKCMMQAIDEIFGQSQSDGICDELGNDLDQAGRLGARFVKLLVEQS